MEGLTPGRLTKDGIKLYEPADFAGMHAAGKLAAEVLDMIAPHVEPGVSTGHLDQLIQTHVEAAGAKSATIGYRGYQHASCISINHVVCHGIPGSNIPASKHEKTPRKSDILLDGDILNIDVTVILAGWYGDTSRMYIAGTPKPYALRLIEVTHICLKKAIEQVRPGNTFNDIGVAIQTYAEAQNMSVVRDFCGHGLGRVFHAPPNVLHYAIAQRMGPDSPIFEPGMFFTIEPMINLGGYGTKVLSDDWTAITKDKSLSAQFEHSVGVTETGCEIFTLSPAGTFYPSWS